MTALGTIIIALLRPSSLWMKVPGIMIIAAKV
jgi:hypothetical protein